MIGLIKRILKVAENYKYRIYWAAVFAFLKSVLAKSAIVVTFVLISGFIEGDVTGRTCFWAGLALILSIVLQCVFQNAADRLQSAAGFEIFSDMRLQLGEHLRRMPMGFFTEGNIGRISSVLSTDMNFIEENLMMLLADLMSEIFSAAIFVVFMFFFDWRTGCLSLAVTLVIYIIGELLKKNAIKHSVDRQEASEQLTDAVIDFTEGIGIIKTYNMLGDKSKELTESFEVSCEKNLKFEMDYAPWAMAINVVWGLGTAAMLGVASYLHVMGDITLSYYVGMLLFVLEVFGPLKAFYGQVARLTVMDACLDRIESIFEEEELPDAGKEELSGSYAGPEIEFENVSFGYDEKDVLKNVSFAMQKQTMTALVGPSGGGKSTIASILARFWDVREGRVILRGKDIRNISMAALMDNISMVFQRVYLFQDTVYNNISMGRLDATPEEVYEAARKAGCYDFIMSLPNGFDTVIGEGGASLSGGEQQRISIARCILKDAPIVILDEATASVDADNESHIQSAISELVKGKTLLVIAHRLHTISGAEQILVVKDGEIAECGRHTELLEQKGIYADMVNKRASMKSFINR